MNKYVVMTAPAKCAKTGKSRNGWILRSDSSKVRQDCSHGLPVWSAAANIFSHKRLQSSCQRDADAAKRDKENLLLMETLKWDKDYRDKGIHQICVLLGESVADVKPDQWSWNRFLLSSELYFGRVRVSGISGFHQGRAGWSGVQWP